MPTQTKTKENVDTFLANIWPTIVARQENYRLNKGRYWQGLRTHLAPPAHTQGKDDSKPGDNLNAHPHDQFEDWAAVFPEWKSNNTSLPCSVSVDAYNGPLGQGWTLTVEMLHEGQFWFRTLNVGPETYRACPWTLRRAMPGL